jgi:hypothetical protein
MSISRIAPGLTAELFGSDIWHFHARDWSTPCLSCPVRSGNGSWRCTKPFCADNHQASVAKTCTLPHPPPAPRQTQSLKSSCAHDGRATSPTPRPRLTTPTSHKLHTAKPRKRRSCASSQTPLAMHPRRTRFGCLLLAPAESQVWQ